jgi:hypothetical protein
VYTYKSTTNAYTRDPLPPPSPLAHTGVWQSAASSIKAHALRAEAAERKKALRDGAERLRVEAAEREQAIRDGAEREKALRDGAERLRVEAAEREQDLRDGAEREKALRDGAERLRVEAAEREKDLRDGAEREKALRDGAERLRVEAAEREKALRDGAERLRAEAAEREQALRAAAAEREQVIRSAYERSGLRRRHDATVRESSSMALPTEHRMTSNVALVTQPDETPSIRTSAGIGLASHDKLLTGTLRDFRSDLTALAVHGSEAHSSQRFAQLQAAGSLAGLPQNQGDSITAARNEEMFRLSAIMRANSTAEGARRDAQAQRSTRVASEWRSQATVAAGNSTASAATEKSIRKVWKP